MIKLLNGKYSFLYRIFKVGNDSNLLIVFYVQIMPDD
ncbi:phosphohydrolase, partial [Shigella sonnei]